MEYSEFALNQESDHWIKNFAIEKEKEILEVILILLLQRLLTGMPV